MRYAKKDGVMNVNNKYLIIIIVLLISLAGAVTRIVSLQGKLHESEMARAQIEQERILAEQERVKAERELASMNEEAQKRHEKFFATDPEKSKFTHKLEESAVFGY
jgi:predicted Holliday junction resolvase-like endonuclease